MNFLSGIAAQTNINENKLTKCFFEIFSRTKDYKIDLLLSQWIIPAVFPGSGHRYRGQVALVTLTWSQRETSGLVCIWCVGFDGPSPSIQSHVRDYFLEVIWVTSSGGCFGLHWATCVFVFQCRLINLFRRRVSSRCLTSAISTSS